MLCSLVLFLLRNGPTLLLEHRNVNQTTAARKSGPKAIHLNAASLAVLKGSGFSQAVTIPMDTGL